ncbi:microtubule-associated protein 70-4-like isoform X2 [Typha latifolia]|uniref:microtubule-associated protein 70-4-like isoform X2 n=1 Tax=Typha latifolia TaxID=4733 RepID=UPI003C2F671C
MGSLGEVGAKEMPQNLSDPVVIELNRLENCLREKERELVLAYSEIKGLKLTELQKDKAVVELSNELKRLDENMRTIEKQLEDKNLETKRLTNEKKEALAAQFAAEAALRRVHATLKDEEVLPIEAVIAPLQSEIKKYKNEVVTLQEDKKALERHMKSKEAALVEAENILHGALERALIVESLQNQNLELKRKLEICQEENKLSEKTIRQKVVEVEKLTQTICELEESVLAGGAVANSVRDYQRQVYELNEEKRTLERELARFKVSVNRVASVVANEWKDDDEKVMPVKQWLEDRRFLQGEIQRLRDKVAVVERTAKAEAQLKDKLKVRLKTLEEGLRNMSTSAKEVNNSDQIAKRRSTSQPKEKVMKQPESLLEVVDKKRPSSEPRAPAAAKVLKQPNLVSERIDGTRSMKRIGSLKVKFVSGDNLVRNNLWASRSKLFDATGKENKDRNVSSNGHSDETLSGKVEISREVEAKGYGDVEPQKKGPVNDESEDMVSGYLYDKMQKEVICLRKTHEEKDGILNAKNDEIQILQRKVDLLMKAMETESKKMRREMAAREKEALLKSEDSKQKGKLVGISKRDVEHHQVSPK